MSIFGPALPPHPHPPHNSEFKCELEVAQQPNLEPELALGPELEPELGSEQKD